MTQPPLDIIGDIGWTLVQFLWQGLVVAALLYLILPICRGPVARHNWSLGALVTMAFAPVVTFLFIHGGHGASLVMSGTATNSATFGGDATAPVSLPPSWISWLVVAWLAGVGLLSLRALGGWYVAETLRRHETLALSAGLLVRFRALQQRAALSWPVQFLQSARVTVPVVVGWFRPVILIPLAAITGFTPQQLDALILHELAHIRRLDAFINIVLIAAETILFYHPAIWWVTRRIRIEREHCCDDFAVSLCGSATLYVEALASLETWKGTHMHALAANGGTLKDRAARLLGSPTNPRRFSLSAMAGLAFLGVVATSVTMAQTAQTAHQSFAIRVVDESVGADAPQGPPGEDRVQILGTNMGTPSYLWLKRDGQIDGNVLADAHVSTSKDGNWVIEFRLTPKGRDQFAELTQRNIGHRLAVVVNGTVITAPTVLQPMFGGSGVISADFATKAEANALVAEMVGTNPPVKP